jgi:ferrous iron transport protein B
LTVVLAGNPNAGKTTLFNFLTGLKQKVANYPGVTVEWRSGSWWADTNHATLVDLPGLYSLETTSLDESIALEIIEGRVEGVHRPDVIVAVVDATNLERNLYLVTQLLEHGIPVVIALTMVDLFEKRKHSLDIAKMSQLLGVPVVALNAAKGVGAGELWSAVNRVAGRAQGLPSQLATWGPEGNENARIFSRYSFISSVVQGSVQHHDRDSHYFSERLDGVLTHRFFGLVILLSVLLLVFQMIFSWAAVPMDLMDQGFGWLGDTVRGSMPEGILRDLLVDGVIAGVGGVLIFLPQILLLFLFISILEDSGYMARAAFLLDKVMSKVGLHGKAFLPLMSSFACAIPGIMATRTIENSRDRFATILIAPLMSCSARLPVYTLMIGAFFSGQYVFGFLSTGAVLMLAMYVLGISVAIAVAFVLKRTVLRSDPAPFILELPPYRLPNLRTVLQNMYLRAWMFLKRAGTVILSISIILWAMTYFPRSETPSARAEAAVVEEAPGAEAAQLENSFAGMLGRAVEPVIAPLGYDWKIGVALIASFAAREVLVSTLSIIYNVGKDESEESDTLINAVREARRPDGSLTWTPLTALSLMVFFVLAMQCMSTLAIVRRETNSWRWPLLMVTYMTALAYIGALITYQGGRLLGFQ